jgi:hypothetical protein
MSERVIDALKRIRTGSFRRNPAADSDFLAAVFQNKRARRSIYVEIFSLERAESIADQNFVINFFDFAVNFGSLK